MVYDNKTRTTRNPDGVDIKIRGWGDPYEVKYWNSDLRINPVFKVMIKMLENDLAYASNKSLRAAPYDWRKGPSQFCIFDDLK